MSISARNSRKGWSSLLRAAMLAPLLMALAGCSVGPNFVSPKPPVVTQYTQGREPSETVAAAGKKQHFEPTTRLAADWWRMFQSAKLDEVIQSAIAGNQDLKAARGRLRQSQETLKATFGVFLPQVDASMGASRQRFSSARFGSVSSSIFNLYTATATVSYALDVFGGSRRAYESQRAQMEYQHDEVLATYLTLLGNVVNAIVAQALYRAEIEATTEIISFTKEQLEIVKAQAEAGTVPYANVLSIRSQLSTFEASLPPLYQSLDQNRHLLASLVGRTPAEWSPPLIGLGDLTLPSNLPVTLPSLLVQQRPDILAAEAQLHSASASIGVATAALLPSFTLNASYGQENNSVNNLFDTTNSIWSLGANVTAPLFHGGTLWFQRKAALEAFKVSLASYRQTVISAFTQVANVLRALEHDAQALRAQAEAVDSASQALKLLQANFEAGTADYLQILTADTQYQQARIAYLQAQAQQFLDTTALFVALGGGWWNTMEER